MTQESQAQTTPVPSIDHVDPTLLESIKASFLTKFSQPPTHVVAAPGRVNLIGEHIDYNDGFVMPMAIERYVVIAAAISDPDGDNLDSDNHDSDHAEVHSVELGETQRISVKRSPEPKPDSWVNYVAGVIAGLIDSGSTVPAFKAVIDSNVPVGGGLSSSAALEVATATLIESLTGTAIGDAEKALICQGAEHRFAGVPCGIMDQFSSVFGKPNELMLLDCQSQEIKPVPFATQDITVLITNSNVKHELTGGEYARASCGLRFCQSKIGMQELARFVAR